MILQIAGGIVRAVLAAYGGKLVEGGLLTSDQLQQGIGAVLVLMTILWSVWQKRRAATVPGGAYNPKAEVRRARRAGGAALPALACVAAAYLGVGAVLAPLEWEEIEPLPEGVIYYVEREDGRPFLVRLLSSLRLRPEAAWPLRVEIRGGVEF